MNECSISRYGFKILAMWWLAVWLMLPFLSILSPLALAQNPTVAPTPKPTPTPPVIPAPRAFTQPPNLAALSAVAVDADTGKILYAKDPYKQLPQASTTKIMTALTLFAIPGVDLNDYTVVAKADLVGEASMDLHTGMRLKVVDLLYGLLLDSANDAATALARYGGTKLPGDGDPVDKFVAEMNHQAALLGLWNTHFINPHGLDSAGHYSSAEDLAVAGWYALQNPTIASIVKLNTVQLDGFWFANISNFIRRYVGATGIKPGQTDNAGLCLVASASRYGHRVIIVEMNNPNLATESDLLMDYAFSQLVSRQNYQAWNPLNLLQQPLPDLGYIGYPNGDHQLQPLPTNAALGLASKIVAAFSSVLVPPLQASTP